MKEIHQKHLGDEADALRSSLGLKTAVAEFATDLRQAGADFKKAMNVTGNALGEARITDQYNNTRAQDGALELAEKFQVKAAVESNIKSGDKAKYKTGWSDIFDKMISSGKIFNIELKNAMTKFKNSKQDDDLQAVFKLMKAYGSKPDFKSATYTNGQITFTDTAGANAIQLSPSQIQSITSLTDETKKIERLKEILGQNTNYSGSTSEASETQLKQIVQSIQGAPTPPTPPTP